MTQQVAHVPVLSATHCALGSICVQFPLTLWCGKRPNDFKSFDVKNAIFLKRGSTWGTRAYDQRALPQHRLLSEEGFKQQLTLVRTSRCATDPWPITNPILLNDTNIHKKAWLNRAVDLTTSSSFFQPLVKNVRIINPKTFLDVSSLYLLAIGLTLT